MGFLFYYAMLLFVMSLQIAFNVHAYTFDMCNNKVYLLTYLLTYLLFTSQLSPVPSQEICDVRCDFGALWRFIRQVMWHFMVELCPDNFISARP